MGLITLFRNPVNLLAVSGSHYLFRDPVTFLTVSRFRYLFRDPPAFLTVSGSHYPLSGSSNFSYSWRVSLPSFGIQ